MNTKLTLLFLLLCSSLAFSQQQKQHKSNQYVDTLNRFYIQTKMPVYIYVSTSPDLKPVQLNKNQKDADDKKREPLYVDGNGKHTLKHFDQTAQEEIFEIYADGTAPETKIFFENAQYFQKKDKNFYGKGLKVELKATDDMAGVNQMFHSVNGAEYQNYALNTFDKEGDYNYQYYTVDNVGNPEIVKKATFTVDLSAPKTYYNIVGITSKNIISVTTQIYLTPTDSISGVAKTFYKIDDTEERSYKGGNLPIKDLSEGEHTIKYYSIDNVNNVEKEGSISFFLDRTAPIVSSDILGDKFIVGDRVYFSGRTKLKLTAVDNKSGVKQTLYSIDNGQFTEYQDPFYLPNKSGLHIVKYFAIDNMSNEGVGKKKFSEYEHNTGTVFVDLTGPSLYHKFVGNTFKKGDSIYINKQTTIQLTATDHEAGVQSIKYGIDKDTYENNYATPFTIGESGMHTVHIYGYDNVNNRNIDEFSFIVDGSFPEIFVKFSITPTSVKDGIPVYPSYVSMFLASTDSQTGIGDIRYKINDGSEKIYKEPIGPFEKGKEFTVEIKAYDKLGNLNTQTVKFKTDKY